MFAIHVVIISFDGDDHNKVGARIRQQQRLSTMQQQRTRTRQQQRQRTTMNVLVVIYIIFDIMITSSY